MPKTGDESHQNPGAPEASRSCGVLEGANRIVRGFEASRFEVYSDGAHVASLQGCGLERELTFFDPLIKIEVYEATRLYWTHTGTLRKLKGDVLLNIVGPSMCIIAGKHTPLWDPRPGMIDVRFAVPVLNPTSLTPPEVFRLVMTRL